MWKRIWSDMSVDRYIWCGLGFRELGAIRVFVYYSSIIITIINIILIYLQQRANI